MFHLNTLSCLKINIPIMDILEGGIERLVSAAFAVVDIFADHSPIIKIENLFSQNLIGLYESVEDKSAGPSVSGHDEAGSA